MANVIMVVSVIVVVTVTLLAFVGLQSDVRTSLTDTLASGESPRARGRVDAALDVLHRYSLIEVTDTSVSMHRLLQKVVRDDAHRRGDTTGGEAALEALAAAFPN